MACEICGASCSLCPYCGSDYCPHINDNNEKYWIYAKDRKGCYLDCIFKTNDKTALLKKILAIKNSHKKWAKKYTTSTILGECIDGMYPNIKRVETPYVNIIITEGDCNWYSAINLVLNINEHKFYTYKVCNLVYGLELDGLKEWNEKLRFIKRK